MWCHRRVLLIGEKITGEDISRHGRFGGHLWYFRDTRELLHRRNNELADTPRQYKAQCGMNEVTNARCAGVMKPYNQYQSSSQREMKVDTNDPKLICDKEDIRRYLHIGDRKTSADPGTVQSLL
ncbi:hypothetical protein QAD02_003684 [Eretmocerus hayati]|uniref:Uncharacterized protein n=2 Tax=Eretmocerus hayati TaxID=131215 RepID=A0ACC2NLG1_9HYME|nr:hypothetical protein QAD02_003359 [Eretmocerus hayati]KAJ8672425.1 hypothetical protein QAD02_003684 [Eretmocerus hayati]